MNEMKIISEKFFQTIRGSLHSDQLIDNTGQTQNEEELENCGQICSLSKVENINSNSFSKITDDQQILD